MLPPLNIDVIQQQLKPDARPGPVIEVFERTDSTNSQALARLQGGHNEVYACFAEQQSAGRGRRGRSWVSPPGTSIYMSLVWPFTRPAQQLTGLSLAMAVAVERSLQQSGITHARIKWPNDVLIDGAKIAGILIETANITRHSCTAVIGVGLNVDMSAAAPAIDHAWTDVVSVLGRQRALDRSMLAGVLLNECLAMCQRYQRQGPSLLHDFQQHYQQQAVVLQLGNGDQIDGVAVGINDMGELRVLVDGEERVFNSADVSLSRTA